MLLRELFLKMEVSRGVLTDDILIKKAQRIGWLLVLPGNFNHSSTWLLKFKKKCGINSKIIHGEVSATNALGIETARTRLLVILVDYELDDIYNLDEAGLFYWKLPTRTLVSKSQKGGEIRKGSCHFRFHYECQWFRVFRVNDRHK